MKKMLSLLVLTVMVATSCSSAKKSSIDNDDNKNLSFTYTAITRGTNNKVVIKDGTVETTQSRLSDKPVIRKITDAEWASLKEVYNKKTVKDANLQDIYPPSKKHQFDGALGATLQITRNDIVYSSSTFDHGNPPSEIKDLVNKIIELSALDKK